MRNGFGLWASGFEMTWARLNGFWFGSTLASWDEWLGDYFVLSIVNALFNSRMQSAL
jgi:hypothetical protein